MWIFRIVWARHAARRAHILALSRSEALQIPRFLRRTATHDVWKTCEVHPVEAIYLEDLAPKLHKLVRSAQKWNEKWHFDRFDQNFLIKTCFRSSRQGNCIDLYWFVLLCHFTFHDVSRWTKIRPAPPRDMWSTWVPALPRVATAMAARGPEMTRVRHESATAINNNKTRIDTPQWVQYCLYLSKATWNHQVDSINWYWIHIECMNLCVLLKQHFLWENPARLIYRMHGIDWWICRSKSKLGFKTRLLRLLSSTFLTFHVGALCWIGPIRILDVYLKVWGVFGFHFECFATASVSASFWHCSFTELFSARKK